MLQPVNNVSWGTDPESFFARNHIIIGSEHIIPAKGFAIKGIGKIVRDGVQFEFNPATSKTVIGLGRNLGALMGLLHNVLTNSRGISCCWNGLVEVSRDELDRLIPQSRVLGCMPSFNYYGDDPIKVDPLVYRKRSAGGHLHFGLPAPIFDPSNNVDHRVELLPYLETFLGNTSVLLDRDPGAVERRENYGRAGEYRLPIYGLEYRTISNFWIRDYILMSFVFGMANFAISAFTEELTHGGIQEELRNIVDLQSIRAAINHNDFKLAMANFKSLRPFLEKHLPPVGFPLAPIRINRFLEQACYVERNRMSNWFSQSNPINGWRRNEYTEFDLYLGQ